MKRRQQNLPHTVVVECQFQADIEKKEQEREKKRHIRQFFEERCLVSLKIRHKLCH